MQNFLKSGHFLKTGISECRLYCTFEGKVSDSVQNKWLSGRPDTQNSWRTTSFQTCGCPSTSIFNFSSSPQLDLTPKKNGEQPKIVTWLSHGCSPNNFLIFLISNTGVRYRVDCWNGHCKCGNVDTVEVSKLCKIDAVLKLKCSNIVEHWLNLYEAGKICDLKCSLL